MERAIECNEVCRWAADVSMPEHECEFSCQYLVDSYPGQAPCPHCFESSGYVWEHGNDWNSGPWSHQTNIPCKHCNGTGTVDSPLVTADDLDNLAAEEAPRRCKTNIVGAGGECLACGADQAVTCQQPERRRK